MKKHIVYGVHITDRVSHVPSVQNCFTEFGCHIKTRLGLHEVDERACSPNGLILLEMAGDEAACKQFKEKLLGIHGVEVKEMVFDHP